MARLTLEQALELYPSITQEDVALLSGCTIAVIRQQIKKVGKELSSTPTDMWRDELLLENLTQEQMAKKHHTTIALVKHMVYGKELKPREVVSHQQIINFMVEHRGKHSQIEIAQKFNVSQALVAKLNPYKKQYGPIERKTPGEKLEIMKYADAHSIHSAALKFGVSRAAIYRWMEKRNERTAGDK